MYKALIQNYKLKYMKKGFTLIELLVVISIIGLLSSVVLASLNTARNKGSDSAAKSQLSNLRRATALYYDKNGHYGTVGMPLIGNGPTACSAAINTIFADPEIFAMVSSPTVTSKSVGCGSSGSSSAIPSWAVKITLSDGTNWCVDYLGTAKVGTIPSTAAGNEFKCQ